jgi:hypothetical protein
VERVDQNHVKYFLDLKPGKKEVVSYHVTYKRRKVGPELNAEKKREPLWAVLGTEDRDHENSLAVHSDQRAWNEER